MVKSILVAGGYGVVGSHVAQHLRTIGFDGDLVLAGRHPTRGGAIANEVGAEIRFLDTGDSDSVNAAVEGIDIVLAVLKDPQNHLMESALDFGASYVGVTQSADTVSPMLFRMNNRHSARPVVTLGHWQAGMATNFIHYLSMGFEGVDEIKVGALFDRNDPIGPMASDDASEYMSRALIRKDGEWCWVNAPENSRTVVGSNGEKFPAIPMGVLDTMSLAAITDAPNIRFDIGIADSLGTKAGGPASHEIYIEMCGTDIDGYPKELRTFVSAEQGHAHFTALGIAAAAEALIEGRARSRMGNWHLPETLIDPVRAVKLASQCGAVLHEEEEAPQPMHAV